ncbi:MAG: hypothetical protein WB489_00635 [Pseudolabrys sp.]
MKLGTLAAAAAISLVGVTGASAQVFVAEPYVAPPIYAAPAPAYGAPAPVIVGEPLYVAPVIGGYVPPKYSYTINSPRRGMIYSSYRPSVECTVDGYCY